VFIQFRSNHIEVVWTLREPPRSHRRLPDDIAAMFRCAACLFSEVIRITASVDEHKPMAFSLSAIAVCAAPGQLCRDCGSSKS
jgi:hypothetical protein